MILLVIDGAFQYHIVETFEERLLNETPHRKILACMQAFVSVAKVQEVKYTFYRH